MRRATANTATSLAVLILLMMPTLPVSGAVSGREDEPVILTGADLSALNGYLPSNLVGFRRETGSWVQVPVQVDQRAVVDLYTVLDLPPGGVELLTYTDPGTFTGGDPDPLFDDDDELVFLAGSGGDPIGAAAHPAGTLADKRAEVRLQHPVSGEIVWLYLFVTTGELDPAAGSPPIGYVFDLLSGDYRTTYNTGSGTNPEASAVATPVYTVRFSDRWIRDGQEIHAGASTGVDILDRHRTQFTPTNCARTEDTFSNGAGAFIVNKTGPVRALRGYMGANSGPTTHRIHAFYRDREVVWTVLRVHEIIGVMDFMDYAPAAAGMVYSNNLNPAGVEVDGATDSVAAGPVDWEMITGSQGTVAQAHRYLAEQEGLTPTSYYADDAAPAFTPCAGDGSEYGASGPRFDQRILNTDPALEQQAGELYRFELIRTLACGPPDQPNSFAENLAGEIAAPLEVTVTSSSLCPDGDRDDYAVCDGVCEPPVAGQCGDCNDGNASVHPGAAEVCNGVDDDCDRSIDEDVTSTFYRDSDGDGFGDPGNTTRACSRPGGYVGNSEDCDDGNAAIHPGKTEHCNNGIDDDCDALVDGADPECPTQQECPDVDGDGYALCDGVCAPPVGAQCGECNDADAGISPGAPELCNGMDDDCSNVPDDPLCTNFDINGDHRIDARELSWVGRSFGLCSADPVAEWWRPADFDASGCIDGDDLAILANLWGLDCVGDLLVCP